MRDYACAILRREGKILLGRRRSPHRKAYACCWDVIGGRVEDGESLGDALRRELTEELGIVPVSYEFLSNVIDSGPQGRGEANYYMHLVRVWTGGEPAMMDDEHTGLTWFSIEEACALPDLALTETWIPFAARREGGRPRPVFTPTRSDGRLAAQRSLA